MGYLKEFSLIVLISLIGELIKSVSPLPIPASIYGLLLMLAALKFKIIQLNEVKKTAGFLIEIMAVMFIPAAAGVIEIWHIVRPIWLQTLVIMMVSTVAVMAVSGRVTQAVLRRQKRK